MLGIIGAVAGKPKDHSLQSRGLAVPSANGAGTPDGYTTFRSSTDQYTIAVPATWKSVDPSSPGAQAVMDDIEKLNPNLRSTLSQGALKLAENGMSLLAINPTPDAQGFAANVNVVAKPDLTYSDSDLSEIASHLPAEYAKFGATVSGTAQVTFDGHRALRATDELALTTPGGGRTTVQQTQYFVSAHDLLFVVTLSGSDPALETIASTFSTG